MEPGADGDLDERTRNAFGMPILIGRTEEAQAFKDSFVTGVDRARRDTGGDELSSEQRELIERLEALGYAAGTTEMRKGAAGVALHRRGKAWEGWNLYTSGHLAGATLVDMDGNELHTWRCDFWEIWPDAPERYRRYTDAGHWRRAYLYENGDVLGIFEGLGIVKLDKDSNLLWARACWAHHDLEVMPNGEIYVLTREVRILPRIHAELPVLEDYVTVLGPDGTERRKVSLLECIERSEHVRLWDEAERRIGDIFHTNSLEVLDGSIAERVPAFAAGNVMVSILRFNAVAVVDLEREEVVWSLTGGFMEQHDPQVVDGGNVMIFDNKGAGGGYSRIQDVDPADGRVLWEYVGSEQAPFFTATSGAAQRLPNGNTLISESEKGRAFEVQRDGAVVWEFVNPNRVGPNGIYVAQVFEMLRLPPDFSVDWARFEPVR